MLPQIKNQPVGQVGILQGQKARFSLTASGPNCVFVWQKRILNFTDFTDISGSDRVQYRETDGDYLLMILSMYTPKCCILIFTIDTTTS